MNLKSLFPLFMLEYAGVACVCLYLLGSLVFVRSLLEYAGVCLNFPGCGQVGLSGCGSVWVAWMRARCGPFGFDRLRPDEVLRLRSMGSFRLSNGCGFSVSTGCGPVGFNRIRLDHLRFDRMRLDIPGNPCRKQRYQIFMKRYPPACPKSHIRRTNGLLKHSDRGGID